MKTNYFKQVWHDLRYQPVIGIVSIVGTALAIFLVMVQVMLFAVKVDPLAPEDNRDRLLYGKYLHLDGGSGSMSHATARRLYDNLDGAAPTAYRGSRAQSSEVRVRGRNGIYAQVTEADNTFLRTFAYDWLAGGPYDASVAEAGSPVAVIDATRARLLFGSPEEAVGREMFIRGMPFTVTGVFADVSALATTAFSEVFVPIGAMPGDGGGSFWGDSPVAVYFGDVYAVIPAKSRDDFDRIRSQVNARKQAFYSELKQQGIEPTDHGSPFTQEEQIGVSSNTDSHAGQARRQRWLVYAIILLIPAINLSSMTGSRLRHRVAEIGVRRAFGARRTDIFGALLVENMIVTLIGAAIGLLLVMLVAGFMSDVLFADTSLFSGYAGANRSVPLGFLLNWRVFGMTLLFCFILNLLSAGVPAWRASRLEPANSLKKL